MSKKVVIYTRVSSEAQAGDDKVSIEQQLIDCKALCDDQRFEVVGTYIDKAKYEKTRSPNKGKIVQPSGRYDDRPAFLEMLAHIETGEIDAVVYWDNYRLGRHYRVLGTLANSLDIAGVARNGRGDVELWEANKKTSISRVMLGIMISIAQEENETKIRRVKMGKIGTLQQGRWPGVYKRYGYSAIKEPGKRGVEIIIHPQEAEAVKLMYDLSDKGRSLVQISKELIARDIPQKDATNQKRKRDWTPGVIGKILRSRDYIGQATYRFSDGVEYIVEIPQIITPKQWSRVQRKLTARIQTATRKTAVTWAAIQHIAYCGECGGKFTMSSQRWIYMQDKEGRRVKYDLEVPKHTYACCMARKFKGEVPHSKTYHYGPSLDYSIWRRLVDEVIKNPELIREQVMNRRQELQNEGDSYDGQIAQAERKLKEIEDGRSRLMRHLAKGIINDDDFERIMVERNNEQQFWTEEINRLRTLRDDVQKIESDLEYAYQVLSVIEGGLGKWDMPPGELKSLPSERRIEILSERKRIIRSLCERVTVYADGRIVIDGLIEIGEDCVTDCAIHESRL